MIYHTVHDLRTASWAPVRRERIRPHLDSDGNPVTRQVVRWHRPHDGIHPFRAYIVLMSDGDIFVVFFNYRATTEEDRARFNRSY